MRRRDKQTSACRKLSVCFNNRCFCRNRRFTCTNVHAMSHIFVQFLPVAVDHYALRLKAKRLTKSRVKRMAIVPGNTFLVSAVLSRIVIIICFMKRFKTLLNLSPILRESLTPTGSKSVIISILKTLTQSKGFLFRNC